MGAVLVPAPLAGNQRLDCRSLGSDSTHQVVRGYMAALDKWQPGEHLTAVGGWELEDVYNTTCETNSVTETDVVVGDYYLQTSDGSWSYQGYASSPETLTLNFTSTSCQTTEVYTATQYDEDGDALPPEDPFTATVGGGSGSGIAVDISVSPAPTKPPLACIALDDGCDDAQFLYDTDPLDVPDDQSVEVCSGKLAEVCLEENPGVWVGAHALTGVLKFIVHTAVATTIGTTPEVSELIGWDKFPPSANRTHDSISVRAPSPYYGDYSDYKWV